MPSLKPTRGIIIGILLALVITTGIVLAADYYRLNHGESVSISAPDGNSYTVTNSHASNDYFIPAKTTAEWNSFKSAVDSSSVPGMSYTIGHVCYYSSWYYCGDCSAWLGASYTNCVCPSSKPTCNVYSGTCGWCT